jgi:hypothetical protein
METNSFYNLREFDVDNLDFILSDDLTFTGNNFFARLKLNDNLTCSGQSTFTNAPTTLEQQVTIPKDHLVTKEYVDSVDTNGGKNYYLNYSQIDPIYTLYKTLSPSVDVVSQQSIQVLALGTNLLAQFISPAINVSRLQAGLFLLNQFGTRTGTQGTVQFYFQIYLFSTNTLVGTSGLSNNASTTVDLFTMVFNLTSNIEVLTTERLVLKLYSVGTSTNNANVTAYFEGDYYSFLTTTLNRASDLLGTNNEWTGQNYFENPPNDPKEVATTDTVVFSMTSTSNTWTNTNNFLTKTSPNLTNAVATTAYCDNLVLTTFDANNTWGVHLFTNETNSPTQLATCKYVLSKVLLPNINNTFSGINIFPTPTPNSQEPASTKYVKDKFFVDILSRNNDFTGTLTTFTKSNPGLTNIATTSFMVSNFLGNMTLGPNVSCQTVTTNGISLANSSSTRTIVNSKKTDFLADNNTLDIQTFVTQSSSDNSTRIATTGYVNSITFSSFLSSTNNWTGNQNYITQPAGTSNTIIATTAFCDTMTYSMNNEVITGNHTVPTASTALTGGQIANLDYTIANKPNLSQFLPLDNSWGGLWDTITATAGTNTDQMASTAFMKSVFYTDLLSKNNTWGNLSLMYLPAIIGTTNVSTQGATTNCIPNYLLKYLPSTTNAPAINFTGTVLTPSPSGLSIDTRVANTLYTNTTIVSSFENAGNGTGIEFIVNQRCPTRTTTTTQLANCAFVAGKLIQYFTTSAKNSFLSSIHTWTLDNFFYYALSTLNNSTLGATCSYVSENFFKTNSYSGITTLGAQPIVNGTYPSTVGQIGYTQTFTATKIQAQLPVGITTLIDFGTITQGTYLFCVREAVTISGNTASLNFMNFFWGPTTALPDQSFSQFCGSGAWITTPTILTHGQRLQTGVTTYNRSFIVPFVTASTLLHSVRLTGTLTSITSIQSNVSITRLF